ncbi:MAG: hypothetical protein Q9169_001653 [Polycauliona sp. 2 TL-2023]
MTVAKRVTSTRSFVSESQAVIPTPSKAISNGSSRLASVFVGRISQGVDIRFQLPWNFGDYLNELPRRLGVSEALDAAVDTLATAHAFFCAGNLKPGPHVLAKHAYSLAVLRRDLNDVVKARTPETLAAIMVISISQVFVDPSQGDACTHTNGATRLLTSRGFAEPRDDFERQLLLTLRGSVVFEALLADTIHLTSRDWKILNATTPEFIRKYLDGQWFTCIANLPDLIQRSQAALIMHEAPSLHLLPLELEARALHENLKPIHTRLRERNEKYDKNSVPAAISNHLHTHYRRSLAMALGVGILLNCVLSGLEGTSTTVCEESASWSDEIVDIAELCKIYRPLGSMSMLVALRMAWAGAASLESKERIETILEEYGTCLGVTKYSQCFDLGEMQRRWTLQQL